MDWDLEYMYADVSLLLLSLFLIHGSVWLDRAALGVGAAWIPVLAPPYATGSQFQHPNQL